MFICYVIILIKKCTNKICEKKKKKKKMINEITTVVGFTHKCSANVAKHT